MNPEPLLAFPRSVNSLDDCFFYHTMDLPTIGVVQGEWDLRGKFDDYIGGVELANKSVLDIGTATGFLSFEAEKRGATVTSFDMSDIRHQKLLPFRDKLYYQDHERWAEEYGRNLERWKNAYWLCHRLLKSEAAVYYGDIYNLPRELGEFDVTIVGSVLEHLSDQISALGSIARLTRELIVVNTPLLRTKRLIARFVGSAGDPDMDYSWWFYSTGVYREVFAMLGFTLLKITRSKYYHVRQNRLEERPTLIAVRAELIGEYREKTSSQRRQRRHFRWFKR